MSLIVPRLYQVIILILSSHVLCIPSSPLHYNYYYLRAGSIISDQNYSSVVLSGLSTSSNLSSIT